MLTYTAGGTRLRLDLAPWLSDASEGTGSANNWYANVFRAQGTSISGVTVGVMSVSGTAANRQMTVELYAAAPSTIANLYAPVGSALASASLTNPAANSRNDVAFASPVAVTPGSLYAVVVRNTAANPSTDTFNVGGSGFVVDPEKAVESFHPYMGIRTTDGGSTWTADRNTAVFPLYGGAYIGKRVGFTSTGAANNKLHGDRRVATVFTPPVDLAVEWLRFTYSGNPYSPTFLVYAGIWTPTSTVAVGTVGLSVAANVIRTLGFSSPVVLTAGTKYYIGLVGDGGGNASVCYELRTSRVDWQSAAPEPFGMFAWYDGSTWTESTTHLANIGVYSEVLVPATGGPLVRPNFNGGFNL